MRFRILGPLVFRSGDEYHAIGSARHRKILAALLLGANSAVSIGRLVDVVWEDAPPSTARQQVQNCVGSLRRLLSCQGNGLTIAGRPNSYTLEVAESEVDYLLFRRLVASASTQVKQGEIVGAASSLRDAISLWRGKPLEDVHSRMLLPDVAQLEEARLWAYERLVDLEFSQGHYAEIITDLTGWVHLYPYHEGLHASLAEALHEVSRTAEGLQVIRSLTMRLYKDLAVEPGPTLKRAEQRLLELNLREANTRKSARENDELVHAVKTAVAQLSCTLQLLAAYLPSERRSLQSVDGEDCRNKAARAQGVEEIPLLSISANTSAGLR